MRNARRILCVLFCLCLALSCVTLTAFAADGTACAETGCTGTYENGFCSADGYHYEEAPLVDGVYQIGNAGQLYWFAGHVNGGAADADAVLTDNITVNSAVLVNGVLNTDTEAVAGFRTWNPIGYYNRSSDYLDYTGSFDGKGHTISGLYHSSSMDRVGLFGSLEANASVKNVGVVDSYIRGDAYVGGVVGRNRASTVEGCWNAGVVIGAGNNVAGVSASNSNGSVINCYNTGSVSGKGHVGGVVGNSSGTVSGCYNTGDVTASDDKLGGVVGYSNYYNANTYVYITDCYNTGAVTGVGDAGGVAGYINYTSVENCCNTGDVIVSGTSASNNAVGGVVGETYTASRVTNCYNTGNITSDVKYVGGVVGYNCSGSDGALSNCYNTGTVTGTSTDESNGGAYVGGVVGCQDSGSISNCYYMTDCAADGSGAKQTGIGSAAMGTAAAENGTIARSADQFNSGEVAYTMNGSTSTGDDPVWYQNIDAKGVAADASPVLDDTHGVVYYGYPDCSTNMGYTNFEPVEGETGPHKDADGDYICDICGTEMEKPVEPSEPDESEPTVPSDPTQPSEPEPSKPEVPECEKDETCVLARFDDIIIADWYHDGVHFCVEEGIMNGMGDGVFAPNEPTTRAQLVMMLYRLEGKPSIEGMSEPFTDVAETDWFYEPIVWAYNTKVVNGMTETTFEPNTNVSREQVATILYRYLDTPAGTGDLSGYPDVDKVQDYAKDALVWAVGEGLINGVKQADGTSLLDPAGNATRAQIATILMRYLTA